MWKRLRSFMVMDIVVALLLFASWVAAFKIGRAYENVRPGAPRDTVWNTLVVSRADSSLLAIIKHAGVNNAPAAGTAKRSVK